MNSVFVQARAAPLCVRQSFASRNSVSDFTHCEYKRVRRRGPRSFLAIMRRALPKGCRALPGVVSEESETSTPDHFSNNPQQMLRDNSNSFSNQLNANSQFDASVEKSRPKTAKKDAVLLLVPMFEGAFNRIVFSP